MLKFRDIEYFLQMNIPQKRRFGTARYPLWAFEFWKWMVLAMGFPKRAVPSLVANGVWVKENAIRPIDNPQRNGYSVATARRQGGNFGVSLAPRAFWSVLVSDWRGIPKKPWIYLARRTF